MVGLVKWFPLLFANAKTLLFMWAIFDNITVWKGTHPWAIFSHYKANYGWMSRQFPHNHWCFGDRHWPLTPVLSFCWWQYFSLRCWNLKYSSILSAGAYYFVPQPCRDSIPQWVCWSWHQQREAHSQWTAALAFLYSVCFSHSFLFTKPHSVSQW